MANSLPIPEELALAHSRRLVSHIRQQIDRAGGWISFADYMQLALYAPSLGYYSAGAKKFGSAGDFVTAPEISTLFAQILARQVAEVLAVTNGDVLELGAGTGKLAANLLLELQALNRLPAQYLILEVSADLREVQQMTLRESLPDEVFSRVEWLDSLPEVLNGLVLGNEVLDAMPVDMLKISNGAVMELGVTWQDETFVWQEKQARPEMEKVAKKLNLPEGYTTEINQAANGLIASLAKVLRQGVVLLLDYGFPRHEYYHPQRNQGTLMCHYRHHAHGDPFFYPGLQDITSHVDFSAVAEAAIEHGLELSGYVSQAQFLINCGITDLLSRISPHDMARYAPVVAQAQKLLSPAEMGELFKVIALSKGFDADLLGFARGDKRHTL